MSSHLFRQQVLEQRYRPSAGSVTRPGTASFVLFVAVAATVMGAVFGFAEFTPTTTATGYLVADDVEVSSGVGGVVTDVGVEEGDVVVAGEPLVALQADAARSDDPEVSQEIAQALRARSDAVRTQLDELVVAFDLERRALVEDIAAAREDLRASGSRRIAARVAYQTAAGDLQRYWLLRRRGLVSVAQLEERQSALAGAAYRLSEAATGQRAAERHLHALEDKAAVSGTELRFETARLEERLQAIRVEQQRMAQRLQRIVRAPRSGTVTAMTVREGLAIVPRELLLVLRPEGTVVEGEMLVDGSSAARLREGQRLWLHFEAPSSSGEGAVQARLRQLSESPVPVDRMAPSDGQAERRYLARVSIDDPVDGRQLRPGMRFRVAFPGASERLFSRLVMPYRNALGRWRQ